MRAAGRLGGPGHQPGLCRASGRGASDRPSGNLKGKGKGRVCLGMGVDGHKCTVRGQASTCTLDPATVLWVLAWKS